MVTMYAADKNHRRVSCPIQPDKFANGAIVRFEASSLGPFISVVVLAPSPPSPG